MGGVPPDGRPEAVEETEDVEADDGFREGARGVLSRRLSVEGHVAAGFGARSAQERLEPREGVHCARDLRYGLLTGLLGCRCASRRASKALRARFSIIVNRKKEKSLGPFQWHAERSRRSSLGFGQSGSSTRAGVLASVPDFYFLSRLQLGSTHAYPLPGRSSDPLCSWLIP